MYPRIIPPSMLTVTRFLPFPPRCPPRSMAKRMAILRRLLMQQSVPITLIILSNASSSKKEKMKQKSSRQQKQQKQQQQPQQQQLQAKTLALAPTRRPLPRHMGSPCRRPLPRISSASSNRQVEKKGRGKIKNVPISYQLSFSVYMYIPTDIHTHTHFPGDTWETLLIERPKLIQAPPVVLKETRRSSILDFKKTSAELSKVRTEMRRHSHGKKLCSTCIE